MIDASWRDLIGDARVVGIGETAHHVREYQLLRNRVARFLVSELGFTAIALESGFSEGRSVDRWLHDAADDADPAAVARRGLTYRMGESPETHALLSWMREAGTVRFAGLDLPGDLASMLPALDGLDGFLPAADPEAGIALGRIRKLAEQYAGPHTMPALAAYRAMVAADRDELTVLLAELSTRLDVLRPLYPAADFATARHELRLATLLDQALRAQSAGAVAVNVRDFAMASTVDHLLASGHRVLVSAANNHLQRIPFRMAGFEVPVLGTHLAARLGSGYVAIAVTARAGRTPSRRRAPDSPAGAELFSVDLPAPAEGGVESLAPDDGAAHLFDLRPGAVAPASIRQLETVVKQPVAEAFDVAVVLPVITPTAPVPE